MYINRGCRCVACRAAESAYQRGYYEANRERKIAQSRAWQLSHPDRFREYGRSYYAASERAEVARQRRLKRTIIRGNTVETRSKPGVKGCP
jgi:hypothetical protein